MASKEDRNGMTVQLALQKPCAGLLQEVLRQYIPEKDMHKVLNDPANKTLMESVLNTDQKKIMYPQTGVFNGNYDEFDVSLLYCLIRNLTRIHDHQKGWGKKPYFRDNSVAANIERIRLLRNKYVHSCPLSDKELKNERKNIISCIHGIEKTLPAKSTTFEDAAEEIFHAAKKQEDLEETITKCQGIFFFWKMYFKKNDNCLSQVC